MLTEYIREVTSLIDPVLQRFFSLIGADVASTPLVSDLLVGFINALLVLAVVLVPFLVLAFVLKLIWRFTNALYN